MYPSLVSHPGTVSGGQSSRRRERDGLCFLALVALESGTRSLGRRGNQTGDVRQRRGHRLSFTSYPATTWSPMQYERFSLNLSTRPSETRAYPCRIWFSLSLSFLYWHVE